MSLASLNMSDQDKYIASPPMVNNPRGGLEIPEDAYPWRRGSSNQGLPDWGLDIVQRVGSRLPGLLSAYESAIGDLKNAPALIDNWVAAGGDAFLKGLDPFTNYIRKPFDNLAARGVFDGTMARDAITNLGGLLADDYGEHQAKLGQAGLALKRDNLSDIANARAQAANIASQVLGLGRVGSSEDYSEDKLARWTAYLQFLI